MEGAVLQVLRETLAPDESTRHRAEQQIRELFNHPGWTQPDQDTDVARDRNYTETDNAGVLLQKLIIQHWSPASNDFEPPIVPLEVKGQIRALVFGGLSDPIRKIRLASAFALSSIARFDWPDEYPDLLNLLVQQLNTGSPDAVHGAMRVITEFVKNDLSEDQLLPVVRDLAPALLSILGNPQTHGFSTRASTVHVFRQILKMLETVKEEHPDAVKKALEGLAPSWINAFVQLLGIPAGEEAGRNWEALGLRLEIFRTLTTFYRAFKSTLSPHLSTLLTLSLQNLISLLPLFKAYYISNDPSALEPPSPTSDAGFNNEQIHLEDVASAIFDFLTPVTRNTKIQGDLVLKDGSEGTEMLGGLVGVVVEYMQITRENEEEWLEDPNIFIMEDDDEGNAYGLRSSGSDFIASLMDKYPLPTAKILQIQIHQIVGKSSSNRQSQPSTWWKPLEAILSLLGALANEITEVNDDSTSSGQSPIVGIEVLLQQVVPGLLGLSDTPFLQARAFLVTSQFAGLLPDGVVGQYLGAAVEAMESRETTTPVKISAVKAIKKFLPSSTMNTQSGQILSLLLPLTSSATGETLYLLMETIRALLSLDQQHILTPQNIEQVSNEIYNVWNRCNTDPILTAIIEELFDALASQPSVIPIVSRTLSVRLGNAIKEPTTDETVHVPNEAVQLANSLIRSRGGPLEVEFVGEITAGVMGLLRSTDDMDAVQYGMIHLTLVVRKDCEKLIQWHDPSGSNGIETIFGLLARFLSPQFSESGGIFVGELIMHLFRKAGSVMGGVLPDLLRAVVQRLGSAKLPSFIQSLVLPFAYLFSTEYTSSTIDLLSQIQITLEDGSSKNGLEMVLAAWCETCETISGSWNIRVSDLGMAKLFAMNDSRVNGVIVKGDMIIDEKNRDRIMTRSRTRVTPNQYTQIPFPLKALKLLLKDVQTLASGKGLAVKQATTDVDVEDDDGDDDWDDDDPLGGGDTGEFEFLSSWLDQGGLDSDAQDDDEDLKADPIAQIDLGAHLIQVLRECYVSNSNGLHEMVQGLGDGEKGILKGVLNM